MMLVGGKQGGNWINSVEKYDIDGFVTDLPNMNYRRYMFFSEMGKLFCKTLVKQN